MLRVTRQRRKCQEENKNEGGEEQTRQTRSRLVKSKTVEKVVKRIIQKAKEEGKILKSRKLLPKATRPSQDPSPPVLEPVEQPSFTPLSSEEISRVPRSFAYNIWDSTLPSWAPENEVQTWPEEKRKAYLVKSGQTDWQELVVQEDPPPILDKTQDTITTLLANDKPLIPLRRAGVKRHQFVMRRQDEMPVLEAESTSDQIEQAKDTLSEHISLIKDYFDSERESEEYAKDDERIYGKFFWPARPQRSAADIAAALLLLPEKDLPKRVKLTPEERILLSQLYYENFAIYHSPRYQKADYVVKNSNLKKYLLNDWLERLNRISQIPRMTHELEEKIASMIAEVAEYRRLKKVHKKAEMIGIQSSPSFLLVNKVYDYIDIEYPEVEKILDEYEKKLLLDREDEILKLTPVEIPWHAVENQHLCDLYTEMESDYNSNVLRREGNVKRHKLLQQWQQRLEEKNFRSRPIMDIERQICAFRRDFRDFKNSELSFSKRRRPMLTEYVRQVTREWEKTIDDIDQTMTIDKVIKKIHKTQTAILSGEIKLNRTEKIPKKFSPKEITTEIPHMATCRINRPHMTRRERHLLAMLYRRNNGEYEFFNSPHMSKKNIINKKWKLLEEWAELLTSFGVATREPEELATKISQYKNIVKNHKQCQKEGPDALFMKSEYKLRKIQRPLSPTTELFDLDKIELNNDATDEKIVSYINECNAIFNYPYGQASTSKKSPNKSIFATSVPSPETTQQCIEEIVDMAVQNNLEVILPEETVTPPQDIPGPSTKHINATNSEQTVAEYIWDNLIPNAGLTVSEEATNKILENIYSDCRLMEKKQITTITYDVIDSTGFVTKMAITREENHRDVNFFLWTKYMEVHMEPSLNFYVCYMCEQMSTASGFTGERQRFRHFNTGIMPGSGILAQQALPTIAVTREAKQQNISWVKPSPKHRCVPFLMSTLCEKLASLCHMTVRTTDIEGHSSR